MPTQVVRVQKKGQVTIPLEIRQKLDLNTGDLVTFIETEAGVVIKPAEVIVSEALDDIGKVLKEKGISLDEMVARSRSIREKLIEDEYGLKDNNPETP